MNDAYPYTLLLFGGPLDGKIEADIPPPWGTHLRSWGTGPGSFRYDAVHIGEDNQVVFAYAGELEHRGELEPYDRVQDM